MIGLHQENPTTAIHYDQRKHYNATYHRTQTSFIDNDQTISKGLAKRLANHARKRLTDLGFGSLIEACEVHVSGYGPDFPGSAEDITYQVEFHLPEGGIIGVQSIQTTKGWPDFDHGIFVEEN